MKRLRNLVLIIFLILSSFLAIAQGEFWGVAQQGGTDGLGTIFRANTDGTGMVARYSFTSPYPGNYPEGALTEMPNGKFYGVTNSGGMNGYGVLFQYDPATGQYTKMINFNHQSTGSSPEGDLLLGSNGKLYGTLRSSYPSGWGAIFEYDPATNTIVQKVNFSQFNVGNAPYGRLVERQPGKFCGVTTTGGPGNRGCLYEYNMNTGTVVSLISFNGTNGSYPYEGPTLGTNGKLYGTTLYGGSNDKGVIYSYDFATSTSTALSMNAASGQTPRSTVTEGPNSKFYGMTTDGGANNKGVLYEYDPVANTYTKKVDFNGINGDNGYGEGKMLKLANGKLMGTTPRGGTSGYGVIFEYDAVTQVYTKKCDVPAGSESAYGDLMLGANGKFYFYTLLALFEWNSTTNVCTKLLTFNSNINGIYPTGTPVKATDQLLYGIAQGGINGNGMIYEYNIPDGTFTKKVEFDPLVHGGGAQGSLLKASNGKFYGMTQGGVLPGVYYGTLYEYDYIANTLTAKFTFNQTDGATPMGELTEVAGKLYGLARTFGANGQYTGGTMFRFDLTTSTFQKLYDFSAASGNLPVGKLHYASNGKLYGTCQHGGVNDAGTFFEYDIATSTLTKRFDFPSTFGSPTGWLVDGPNDLIYGVSFNGHVFEYNPDTYTCIDKYPNYRQMYGGFVIGEGGKLYGITQAGILQVDPLSSSYTEISSFYLTGDYVNGMSGVGNITITPQSSQTISFPAIPNKTYGNASFTLNATASSGLPVFYKSSDTNIATVSGNVVTLVGAGSVTITASQAGDGNYLKAIPQQQTFVVSKASLTVKANDQSRGFGDPNPTFTITYTGFIGSDNASAIDVAPTSSCTATPSSNPGTYAISLSGGSDNNYQLTLVNGTLTVGKATLTATADPATKIYGNANPTFTLTYSGFKNGDNASVIDTPPSTATTATTVSNVGSYPITVTGGLDDHYAITLVDGTLSITKAPITATADDKTKIYGDANPTLTISYTGFKGSDTPAVIDTPPTTSTTAVLTSNAGSYAITLSGGLDNNYAITLVNGSLAITKAILTATADNASRLYGDPDPLFTISYAGFKGADNSSVIDINPSVTSTATVASNVGNYTLTPGNGSDNNYAFSYIDGTLTITKASLTAMADATTRIYGDANPTFTITYSGFKNADNASVVDVPPSSSTTATPASNTGSYSITLTGGSDNNYSLQLVNGTLTITKAPLTATADDKSKIYGSTNPAFTITYTGFKGTDNASVIDAAPTASTTATTTSNAGTYAITMAGGSDNNYALTLVNGTLTITKATLTATADPKSKVYGSANPGFTISYSGFKGTDNASVIDVPPTASSAATTTSNVGTYAITPTGGSDNNYTISLVNGTLTITKAPLTAKADDKTKVYGSANPTFTITYTGFKGTDNASVINVAPTASTSATTTSSVGTYSITLSGGSDDNYSLTLTSGTLTITKAALTAKANNASRAYGDPNPAFTITYTGFKGSDGPGVIDIPPTPATTADLTSGVGTYTITLSGGLDNNYTFTLTSGQLTVTKAVVTATADYQTKSYGQLNPALTISYAGLKNGEGSGYIDTPPTAATTATALSNTGSYAITLTGGTDNNYTFTLVNGTLDITKTNLTVTADSKSRVYFNENPVLTFSYEGFVNSEDATVLDVAPSITTTATVTSNAGTYPITLSGGSDNNYQYVFVNSSLTVYKEEQTLVFNDLPAKTIGDPAFILFAVGGPTGNPVTFTSSNPAVLSIFGNVATIVGTGTSVITASQAGNTNYNSAVSVMQTQVVNASSQVITFNALAAKNFGDGDFNPGATASSGLTVTYTSSDPLVASVNGSSISIVGVGSTIITASQGGNANFNPATDVSQTLVVNPSSIVITPVNPSICMGTGTQLNASGATSYSWWPATGLSSTTGASVVASPVKTTTYTITATYANGVTVTTTTTVKVSAIPISAGSNHSVIKYCGSCGAGGVASTGLNNAGQLGDGTLTQRLSPTTLSITDVEAVSAGGTHTLFLKTDGTVWATGLNSNGQLGIGSTVNKSSPTQITTLSGITAISAGITHSLFLKNDGTVWACGLNTYGQLGDGTATQQNSPVQVLSLTNIIKISAGQTHSLFLKDDGTVWAVGRNANGQLGDGTTVSKSTAIQIPGLTSITEIAAGGAQSHFLKSNGIVYATGSNSSGQLGNGTTTQRTTPGALATINYVVGISAGTSHTLFVRSDGTAWATGSNSAGQIGDGTTTNALAPVMVGNLVNVTAASAAVFHSLFLTSDGIVWAVGKNTNGQLGNGTTVQALLPVQAGDVTPCGRLPHVQQPQFATTEDIHILNAYPSPVDDQLTIDLPQGAPLVTTPITIFDQVGKPVVMDQFNPGEATKTVNTEHISSGIYLLHVKTVSGTAVQKIIVLH